MRRATRRQCARRWRARRSLGLLVRLGAQLARGVLGSLLLLEETVARLAQLLLRLAPRGALPFEVLLSALEILARTPQLIRVDLWCGVGLLAAVAQLVCVHLLLRAHLRLQLGDASVELIDLALRAPRRRRRLARFVTQRAQLVVQRRVLTLLGRQLRLQLGQLCLQRRRPLQRLRRLPPRRRLRFGRQRQPLLELAALLPRLVQARLRPLGSVTRARLHLLDSETLGVRLRLRRLEPRLQLAHRALHATQPLLRPPPLAFGARAVLRGARVVRLGPLCARGRVGGTGRLRLGVTAQRGGLIQSRLELRAEGIHFVRHTRAR
mmetsp:Transcript_52692/g.138549  ORF Transcript_52692/g.138549 Transcript_52692/m.138549 type:complete len:322 (-) Transcript_52692:262-1227(-)